MRADSAATIERSPDGIPEPEAPVAARRGPIRTDWALIAILLLAAVNFLWQLGSSDYFLDEVLSIAHAGGPVGQILSRVSHTELTPWTYFLGLHAWLRLTGSEAEWVTRLPSALAGIGLVGAVYWMGRCFLGRRGALAGASLAALSPLLLQYAQQTRVYALLALACTLAVAVTIGATTRPHRQGRHLALGAGLCVLSLWLHYTAVFVILPLCAWLAVQRAVPVRARGLFVAVSAVAEALVIPLFVYQHGHQSAAVFPGTTAQKLVRVLETPFDGRFGGGIDVLRLIGVAVVIGSLGTVLHYTTVLRHTGSGGRSGAQRRQVDRPALLFALAFTAPLVLIVAGLAGSEAMISRYAVVATPFLIVAVVAAVQLLPRLPASALGAAAVLLSTVGLAESHQSSGFYAPTKSAVVYVRAHRTPDDVVLLSGSPGPALGFYLERLLPSVPTVAVLSDPALAENAVARHARIWVISELARPYRANVLHADAGRVLARLHYRLAAIHEFTTTSSVVVYLAVPD